MKTTTKLRQMLNSGQMVTAPFVLNAMHAKIAQSVGFDAVYMTGCGTAAKPARQVRHPVADRCSLFRPALTGLTRAQKTVQQPVDIRLMGVRVADARQQGERENVRKDMNPLTVVVVELREDVGNISVGAVAHGLVSQHLKTVSLDLEDLTALETGDGYAVGSEMAIGGLVGPQGQQFAVAVVGHLWFLVAAVVEERKDVIIYSISRLVQAPGITNHLTRLADAIRS